MCTVSLATIVNTLGSDVVQIGTWLNVIGYVTAPAERSVQAIAVWDFGPVMGTGAVRDVEAVTKARRGAMEGMRRARQGYAAVEGGRANG